MEKLTKLERLILTIYLGNTYSTYRDNSLSELRVKSKKYVDEFMDDISGQQAGGFAISVMQKVLSGSFTYNGVPISSELEKVWLSIVIGFEKTCLQVKKFKKMLSIVRFTAAPPISDKNFSLWTEKYKIEVSAYASLIDGLENLPTDFDIHEIIFNES